MKFNKDLSAIHGYLCGDGYVVTNPLTQKHKYYHIGFRNTNEILLKDFQNRFKRVFKIKPIIYGARCIIHSKELYYKLTNDYSYYSHEWVLPNLSKNNLRYWLRAFFDCEAWVYNKKRKDRHIGLDSVNHNGLLQIQNALKIFKIESKIKMRKNRNISRLYIFGKNNLIRYAEEIEFLHPNKNKKLDEAIKSFVDYTWEFPEDKTQLKSFITCLMKEKAKVKKPFIVRVLSIKRKNLEKLSKYLHTLFNIETKVYGPRFNGYGTEYYELTIQRKIYVKKLLQNNLLNEKEILKLDSKLFKDRPFQD